MKTSRTVAIVDDREASRRRIVRHLRGDFVTKEYESATELLNEMTNIRPFFDYVLADLDMGDGLAAPVKHFWFRTLRHRAPNVKIIAYSTVGGSSARLQAYTCGAHRYFCDTDLNAEVINKLVESLESLGSLERQLAELKHRNRYKIDIAHVLDNVNTGIGIVDREGMPWYLNRWNRKFSSYQYDSFGPCWLLHHGFKSRAEACPGCPSFQCMKTGKPVEGRKLYLPVGDERDIKCVELAASPIKSDGNTVGAVESVRDITADWKQSPPLERIRNLCNQLIKFGFKRVHVYRLATSRDSLLCMVSSGSRAVAFKRERVRLSQHAEVDDILRNGLRRILEYCSLTDSKLGITACIPTDDRNGLIVAIKSDLDEQQIGDYMPYFRCIAGAFGQASEEIRNSDQIRYKLALIELQRHLDICNSIDEVFLRTTEVLQSHEALGSKTAFHFRIYNQWMKRLEKVRHGRGGYFRSCDSSRYLNDTETTAVRVFLSGKLHVTSDIEGDGRLVEMRRHHPELAHIESYGTFSLIRDMSNESYGTLNIQSDDCDFFNTDMLAFIEHCCQLIYGALTRVENAHGLSLRQEVTTFARSILSRGGTPRAQCMKLAKDAANALDAKGCSIFLRGDYHWLQQIVSVEKFYLAGTTVLVLDNREIDDPDDDIIEERVNFKASEGLAGWVAGTKQLLNLPSLKMEMIVHAQMIARPNVAIDKRQQTSLFCDVVDRNMQNKVDRLLPVLLLPLVARDICIGVLQISGLRSIGCLTPNGFCRAQVEAASELADVLAAYAANWHQGRVFVDGALSALQNGVMGWMVSTGMIHFANMTARGIFGMNNSFVAKVADLDPFLDASTVYRFSQNNFPANCGFTLPILRKGEGLPRRYESTVSSVNIGSGEIMMVMEIHPSVVLRSVNDMMHELSAPINSAVDAAELAWDSREESQVRMHIYNVRRELRNARGNLHNLDALMKLRMGGTFKESICDLHFLITNAIENAAPAAVTDRRIVRYVPVPGIDVKTNAFLVGVVLSNLIRNAVEHRDKKKKCMPVDIEVLPEHSKTEIRILDKNVFSNTIDHFLASAPFADGSDAILGKRGVGLSLCIACAKRLNSKLEHYRRDCGGNEMRLILSKNVATE